METLDLAVLVSIIEFARDEDVPNLRLANKLLYSAVGLSGIQLSPPSGITSRQLAMLGRAFPNAAGLTLDGCTQLVRGSFAALPRFFPQLR